MPVEKILRKLQINKKWLSSKEQYRVNQIQKFYIEQGKLSEKALNDLETLEKKLDLRLNPDKYLDYEKKEFYKPEPCIPRLNIKETRSLKENDLSNTEPLSLSISNIEEKLSEKENDLLKNNSLQPTDLLINIDYSFIYLYIFIMFCRKYSNIKYIPLENNSYTNHKGWMIRKSEKFDENGDLLLDGVSTPYSEHPAIPVGSFTTTEGKLYIMYGFLTTKKPYYVQANKNVKIGGEIPVENIKAYESYTGKKINIGNNNKCYWKKAEDRNTGVITIKRDWASALLGKNGDKPLIPIGYLDNDTTQYMYSQLFCIEISNISSYLRLINKHIPPEYLKNLAIEEAWKLSESSETISIYDPITLCYYDILKYNIKFISVEELNNIKNSNGNIIEYIKNLYNIKDNQQPSSVNLVECTIRQYDTTSKVSNNINKGTIIE